MDRSQFMSEMRTYVLSKVNFAFWSSDCATK